MIKYKEGNAARPDANGVCLIVHVCNNRGGWGSGFVLDLSKETPLPEEVYRSWAGFGQCVANKELIPFALGQVQFVHVTDTYYVANMISQDGYKSFLNKKPLNMEALELCLIKVSEFCKDQKISIHMPMIGTGRGGGDWNEIESLIERILGDYSVTVYKKSSTGSNITTLFA